MPKAVNSKYQLKLPFPVTHDENHLVACLQKKTGKAITLVITDNATSMISFRKKDRHVALRLHRLFLAADERILDEIAAFITNRHAPMQHTRELINSNRHRLKAAQPRRIAIKAQGRYHDLEAILSMLNRQYFDGAVSAAITWGRKSSRRVTSRRTLGTYLEDRNVIRINPVLDSRRVPAFYVEFIVYHEMLHAVVESTVKNGRRQIHARDFKRREKLFEHYDRACAWEKNH